MLGVSGACFARMYLMSILSDGLPRKGTDTVLRNGLAWPLPCKTSSPTLLGQDHTATAQCGSGPVCPAHSQDRDTPLVPSVGPSLAHGDTQCITRHPQLTIEDVKLICRVTKPCKRQSPGGHLIWDLAPSSPCTPRTLRGTAPSLHLCPWGGRSMGTDPTQVSLRTMCYPP